MVTPPTYLSRALPGGIPEDIIAQLCTRLFASLVRADQHRKGEQYVRGLLATPGRKSMRNLARLYGGRSAEQGLHHFISDSTWDWQPVRAALAGYLHEVAGPQAWVVRPMVIPKAGTKSVGVGRRFVPELGRLINSQQAFGGWLAAEELSAPVNWRLVLPAGRDPNRGDPNRGDPNRGDTNRDDRDDRDGATLEESASGAVLDVPADRRGGLPVVVDVTDAGAAGVDAASVAARFAAADVPVLLRVGAATRLVPEDRAVTGDPGRELPAHRIAEMVQMVRRPSYWLDPATQVIRISFVAAVQVRTPWPAGGHRRQLRLLAEWEDRRPLLSSVWLTDLAEPPGALLRLARLARRVDRDVAAISQRVGLKDFEGRSFQGWHRHATLASAAHTAAMLATAGAPAARLVQDRGA